MTKVYRFFEDVAKDHKLDLETSRRFINYMRARWVDEENQMCENGYADAWARRFQAGMEFVYSDLEGQDILRRIS